MIKDEHKVIIFSFVAGLSLWVIDAVVDSFVFTEGIFLDSLILGASAHELYFRSFYLVSFVLFGMVISRLLARHKKADEALDKSARFLNTIFDSIIDPFIILDKDFRIVRANEAYAQMKNIPVKELTGKKCHEITRGREEICDDCVVNKTFKSADPCAKEKQAILPDGSVEWVEIYTYPILDQNGSISHVIEYVRNITERKRAEEERKRLIEKLEFLSITDSLTGLLNRRVVIERLNSEIERVKRYGFDLSLILCDLDYFKEINDTYGHNTGDEVLKIVSWILKESVRAADIVGRYGGDEFLLILPETSIKGAEDMAERIRLSVQDTEFPAGNGKSVRTTLSLGITNFQGGRADIHDLINRIDNALYTSKRAGKNQVYTIV